MKLSLTFTLIACLLLNACSSIQENTAQPEPVLPDDPLGTAEELAAAGRWGESVTLIEQAIAQGWGTDKYLVALSETARQQQIHEERLQAQLLLEETIALRKQLPILDKLAYSDPYNQQVAEKLLVVRSGLMLNRKALSECGWKQSERHSSLARQCLTLALTIEANAEDQRLLERLTVQKAQTINKAVKKQRGIREKQWKDRNQDRLQLARQLYQDSKFDESRKQLNLILKEDPDHQEAKKLLSELKIEVDTHLENLLKTGDRMYREGQIEVAKAIWQGALTLDPNDIRAKEKIDRADRVLKNLETLRKTN